MRKNLIRLSIVGALLADGVYAEEPRTDWQHCVVACIDTILERGTDTYGSETTPLVMAVLDSATLVSPEQPEVYDSLIRLEGRIHRRAERGANLWNDQALLRAMYLLSEMLGDPKYAQAADDYVDYYTKHCVSSKGLFVWGSHIHWNCYEDARTKADRTRS